MRLWFRLSCVVICVWTTLLAAPCWAERVVLVRPSGNDPMLSEVFNRLQGELRMHGFETIVASANGLPSSSEMQRVAELGQAAASVALERTDFDLTAHVWFEDREAERARIMSVAVPESEETPALVALRTVELLRSTLRDRDPPTRVPRKAPPKATSTSGAEPPTNSPSGAVRPSVFSMRAEGGLAWSALSHGAVPELGVGFGYRLHSSGVAALRLGIPLARNHVTGNGVGADYRVYSAAIEGRFFVDAQPWLRLEGLVSIGASRVTATGIASLPYVPLAAAVWSGTVALGTGVWLAASRHLRVGSAIRLGLMGPKPVVRVDDQDRTLGRPWMHLLMGFDYAF